MMVLSVTTFDHRLDKRGTIMKTRLRFRIPTDNFEYQLIIMKTNCRLWRQNCRLCGPTLKYWFCTGTGTVSNVLIQWALCNVQVHCAMYWYSEQCTGTVCNFWHSMQCTGTVCNALVQYAMYWYNVQCTDTVCNVLVQCTIYEYIGHKYYFSSKTGPPHDIGPLSTVNLIYLVLKTDTSAVLMLWFICNETFFPFQTWVLSAWENARSAHCERLLTETFNAIAGWWRIEHL